MRITSELVVCQYFVRSRQWNRDSESLSHASIIILPVVNIINVRSHSVLLRTLNLDVVGNATQHSFAVVSILTLP